MSDREADAEQGKEMRVVNSVNNIPKIITKRNMWRPVLILWRTATNESDVWETLQSSKVQSYTLKLGLKAGMWQIGRASCRARV